MLEPAIPPHLTAHPRTHPPRLPSATYEPPTAAYSARFPPTVTDLVMATICTQARTTTTALSPLAALRPLLPFLDRASDDHHHHHHHHHGPACWDLIAFRDAAGVHNVGAIAYWDSRASYDIWAAASGFEAWWGALEPEGQRGWFREVFVPSVERVETIFSDGAAVEEGAARMREGMSGPVREHVYWGSMRDRMAAAQTDGLEGEEEEREAPPRAVEGTERRRVVVRGRRNLCVIRSGQDWSATVPRERKLYLETMHPVLVRGMDFLRDEGQGVGCHSCRFVDVLDETDVGRPTERTFGFAFFNDMGSLENWSKRHRTHLDIFGRFLQYAKELNNDISLRLFHEVLVLTPEQQLLEYVGCHPKTGLVGL